MVIIKGKYGALGNRLWQYAYIIAFGIENKIIVSYPGFDEYAEYFNLTRNNLFCSIPSLDLPFKVPNYLRKEIYILVPFLKMALLKINSIKNIYSHHWVRPGEYFDLDKELMYLTGNKIVTLEGWITRCNRSFVKHSSIIKYLLSPVKKYRKNADRFHNSLRKEYDLIIGFHMRKDLLEFEKLFNYSFKEYSNLMKALCKTFGKKKVAFLMSSDTEIDMIYFEQFPAFLASGHFIEDNYNLSKCDYIIGASSTYTYWSSFFGTVPFFPFANQSFRFDLSDYRNIRIKISDFRVFKHLF